MRAGQIAGWLAYLCILTLVVPAHAMATHLLTPFDAQYKVKSAGLTLADTRFALTLEPGGVYVYESYAEPAGIATLVKQAKASERSRLRLQEGAIVPLEYTYELRDGDESKNYHSEFDWEKSRAHITKQGKTRVLEVPDGTLDRFVLQLAIMLDLKQGRKELRYTVLDNRRLRTYQFRQVGKEHITTPAGDFDVVMIESIKEKTTDKRVTTFWCAPALGYLPVQITYKSAGRPAYKMSLDQVRGLAGGH